MPINSAQTIEDLLLSDSLITKQQLATISLNEVDITKIKLGQKATLSFDAVEDLSLTGKVAEIDTLGTVTSGVVNYDVTIVFDTQDERIKPGMSVSVNIITDLKIDVLMVPNSAIKTQNDLTYVELMKDSIPTLQPIETGITNDVDTEVISCLKENDEIITQTFDSTSFSSNNQSASSQRDNVQGMMRIMPR